MNNKTRRVIIFYHADLDGKCSAAIAAKYYNARGYSCINFKSVTYEDERDFSLIDKAEDDGIVVILDFTFHAEWFEELLKRPVDVLWLDHHRTAIEKIGEELRDKILSKNTIQDDARAGIELHDTMPSGARITWERFSNTKEMPLAVEYIDRWDTWTHNDDEEILDFKAGMELASIHPTDPRWDTLLNLVLSQEAVEYMAKDGCTVNKYKASCNRAMIAKTARIIRFEGLTAIAMNVPHGNSKVFDGIVDRDRHRDIDIYMPFSYTGAMWTVGLFSARKKLDVNLGAIAKRFGGGGHPNAAGFQGEDINWLMRRMRTGMKVNVKAG